MDPEENQTKLQELEEKIDAIFKSVEKTRKCFFSYYLDYSYSVCVTAHCNGFCNTKIPQHIFGKPRGSYINLCKKFA